MKALRKGQAYVQRGEKQLVPTVWWAGMAGRILEVRGRAEITWLDESSKLDKADVKK